MKERLVERLNQYSSHHQSQILKQVTEKNLEKKIASVLKQDKQEIFVSAEERTNFHEAFSKPITSLPLSIASPGSSLYQSDKTDFKDYIMKSSKSISFSFPQIAK